MVVMVGGGGDEEVVGVRVVNRGKQKQQQVNGIYAGYRHRRSESTTALLVLGSLVRIMFFSISKIQGQDTFIITAY